MGSLFRSEDMLLCQFYIQYEAAYSCVSELGELGLVQFRDVNVNTAALNRQFVNEIRRCDEMDRILKIFKKDITKLEIKVPEPDGDLLAPHPKEMVDLEANLNKQLQEFKEVETNNIALNKTYTELKEFKSILGDVDKIFGNRESNPIETGDSVPLAPRSGSSPIQLGFITGVIVRHKIIAFESILWRISRGNAYFKTVAIDEQFEDFETNEAVNKNVFVVFFQGEHLKSKIKKLCDAFSATIYPCPESHAERQSLLDGVNVRLEDLNIVINQTKDHHFRLLNNMAINLKKSFIKVQKMKDIYIVLNMFSNDVTRKCLIAEAWCPSRDITRVYAAVEEGTKKCGSTAPSIVNTLSTTQEHPTFNRTNKVTSGFQNIINAYGVSKYKEVNPAPYTIITFPFLFAVMFGDAGHGIIMALFALWMVWKEKYLMNKMRDNEIWQTFFGGRYIMLLMGIFSIYTGFIYNDMFSLSTNIFGSGWDAGNFSKPLLNHTSLIQLNPAYSYRDYPYHFGIDPVWQLATNKILYLNSYKMKLSVIVGVSQMLYGVILSLFNHLYFKNYMNIFCEFIPQVIFILSIFGYLDFMIVFKWFKYTSAESNDAPSLLITLINMFMLNTDKPMFAVQPKLQMALVSLAAICVPWMLLVKPIIKIINHKRGPPKLVTSDEEEFSVMSIFIDQAIHTIEFCLGSISHTASYLRLWALSLAHSQLSEVLWTMIMRMAIGNTSIYGAFILYFIFAAWAVLTISILLVMEGLSAFLHTLRLHWVEFQSKFYSGSGYLFEPFTLKDEFFNN